MVLAAKEVHYENLARYQLPIGLASLGAGHR